MTAFTLARGRQFHRAGIIKHLFVEVWILPRIRLSAAATAEYQRETQRQAGNGNTNLSRHLVFSNLHKN